jgi:hypothetical protein
MNIHSELGETWAFIYHNWANYETVRKPEDIESFKRMHGAQSAHKVMHNFSAIYAMKVPALSNTSEQDVRLFWDKEAKEPCGTIPFHYSSKPTRRNKWQMHNCQRYPLLWLPALPIAS